LQELDDVMSPDEHDDDEQFSDDENGEKDDDLVSGCSENACVLWVEALSCS
jgi:hypothetical protein